jgi:hypothetical protein
MRAGKIVESSSAPPPLTQQMGKSKPLILLLFASSILLAGKPKPQHAWKRGTLTSRIAAWPLSTEFTIAGECARTDPRVPAECLTFTVYLRGRKGPNVTIRGPLRYAAEKGGSFFILDEDGAEFRMTMIDKTLSYR